MLKNNASRYLAALLLTALAGQNASAKEAQRPAADEIRHLTPWVFDAVKINAGLPGELDWNRPDAPALQDIRAKQNERRALSGPEETLESDAFVLHYTFEGDDAVTEEQALAAFEAIEAVWAIEVEEMGYPAPPSDGLRGGDSRYDFYFTQQRFTYGVCYGEDEVDSNSMTSYIELATWMDTKEIQVTVAHEFFHALHFTMDALEETWWYEVSATWMEEVVYDDINDYYNYVPSTMEEPGTPLTDSSNMYANSIWAHSLTEALGNDIIQDIWFLCAEGDEPSALASNRAILEGDYGVDYEETLHNWREAFVDRSRFSEGDNYPAVTPTHTASGYPIVDLTGSIAGTAAAVIEIPVIGDATTLSVTVQDSNSLRSTLLVEDGSGNYMEWDGGDTQNGEGMTWAVESFGGDYTGAFVVITNTADSTADNFAVHIEAPGWSDEPSGGCDASRQSGGASLAYLALFGLFIARRRL